MLKEDTLHTLGAGGAESQVWRMCAPIFTNISLCVAILCDTVITVWGLLITGTGIMK